MKKETQKQWDNLVAKNQDDYGKACVDIARKVMEYLDKGETFNCHDLICKADDEVKADGITGYMAGVVASMVSHFHERGDEFKKEWNKDCGGTGEEKGTINPAILTIKT